jgi:hypothetical protein
LIDIAEHLSPASVVAGIREAEALDEPLRALIIFSYPDPDRAAARLPRHSEHLVHDHRTVAASAMIWMHENLSPDQMQVVAARHIQRKYTDRVSRILWYVEIVIFRLELPAVTHLIGQHFGDHWERVGVIDPTRRLLDVTDCGDLAHVVRPDAYESHQTRVPY